MALQIELQTYTNLKFGTGMARAARIILSTLLYNILDFVFLKVNLFDN